MVNFTEDYLSRRTRAEGAGNWVPDLPLGGTFIRNERWNDEFDPDPKREKTPSVDLSTKWVEEDAQRNAEIEEARVDP